MFKLLIVSSLLMVVAASPSLQLLSSLPQEETISLPSLIQSESPSTSSSSSTSSEETADPPAPTGETPLPTQSPSTPSETDTSSSSSLTSSDPEPAAIESLSADELDLLTSAALRTSSLGSATIQHQILPPETISLPIQITTSPGLRTVLAPETIRIHQPTVTKVGELVQKIPTAVSHQSQTVVHKHAEIITPIVAPAVRTITSQVVRAYHTPLVYAAHAPVIKLIQH